jgi:hypothetical protein
MPTGHTVVNARPSDADRLSVVIARAREGYIKDLAARVGVPVDVVKRLSILWAQWHGEQSTRNRRL